MEKQNILFLIEPNKYFDDEEIEKFNKLKDFIFELNLKSSKDCFIEDFKYVIKNEKIENLYENIHIFNISEEAIENILYFKYKVERKLKRGKLIRSNIPKNQIIMYKDMDYSELLNIIYNSRLKDFNHSLYLITILKDNYQNFNIEKNYSFNFDFNKANKDNIKDNYNENIRLPEDIKTSILNDYNEEYSENSKIKNIFWSCENNIDILNFIVKTNRNEQIKINKKILTDNNKLKVFLLSNNIKTGFTNFIRETKRICNDDCEIKENLYELNKKINKICNDLEVSLKKNIISNISDNSNHNNSTNFNKLDFSPESKKLIETIEKFIINN